MNFDGQPFADRSVEMDGSSFIGATFTRCTLIYRGGALPNIAGSTHVESHWSFADAAANTLLFWAYIEAGQAEGAKGLLERARQALQANLKTLHRN
jgi:hypothetical protein